MIKKGQTFEIGIKSKPPEGTKYNYFTSGLIIDAPLKCKELIITEQKIINYTCSRLGIKFKDFYTVYMGFQQLI